MDNTEWTVVGGSKKTKKTHHNTTDTTPKTPSGPMSASFKEASKFPYFNKHCVSPDKMQSYRKQNNMTRQDMAKKLDISLKNLKEIEKGLPVSDQNLLLKLQSLIDQ